MEQLQIERPSGPTVEELQKRRLGTGSTLDTAESEVVSGATDGPLVHYEILQPQSRPFADCC